MQLNTIEIEFEGRVRKYHIHRPEQWAGASPDVVIACHGGNGDGLRFAERWEGFADHGIWLVFPDAEDHGDGTSWVTFGDTYGTDEDQDGRFLEAIRKNIIARAIVEKIPTPSRWFLTGFSSGGQMGHHCYVTRADMFDGLGAQGSAMKHVVSQMAPVGDVPFLFGCGTLDENNYDPRPPARIGADATAAWYADRHGNMGTQPDTTAKHGELRSTYCNVWDAGQHATGYNRTVGMGHAWPKRVDHGIHGAAAFVEFWERHAGLQLLYPPGS